MNNIIIKIGSEYMIMKHGGDILSYQDKDKGEIIDFSSNINPLGPPKKIKEILIGNYGMIEAYPDIYYRKLKNSLSKYLGCEKKNILAGNGAMEIIDIFASIANRVVLIEPSFSEYKERALAHSKELVLLNYKENFKINMDDLEQSLKKDDLLIIGNPNNPTGLRIEKETLIDIYDLVRKRNAVLLLDEAFFEFAPLDYDSVKLFSGYNYQNLGIIRAATKFFAIPGLRLGYGVTSEGIKEKIESYQMPWTINAFADLAGQCLFDDKNYIKQSRKYIEKERNYLLDKLSSIEYLQPYDTDANYILIKLLKYDEEYIFESLLKHGILVRKCSSFSMLKRNHIRVAIKDRESNKKLIRSLFKIYGEEENEKK